MDVYNPHANPLHDAHAFLMAQYRESRDRWSPEMREHWEKCAFLLAYTMDMADQENERREKHRYARDLIEMAYGRSKL